MQTPGGRREAGHKGETRSKAITMYVCVCEWISIWMCAHALWEYIFIWTKCWQAWLSAVSARTFHVVADSILKCVYIFYVLLAYQNSPFSGLQIAHPELMCLCVCSPQFVPKCGLSQKHTHSHPFNGDGLCNYLAEGMGMCSLSPVTLHLTAHCGCSFLFLYSLQYGNLIHSQICPQMTMSCFFDNRGDKYIAFPVTCFTIKATPRFSHWMLLMQSSSSSRKCLR